MKLKIVENYFAPKCLKDESFYNYNNSHMVVYEKCNFRCEYCDFWENPDIDFKTVDLQKFELVVKYLIKKGLNFKFTGGESTLNTKLPELLKIVKSRKGNIFLDTNGSLPKIVKKLAEKKLVDVLGLSLKGLTKESSLLKSGIKNSTLCWDNPLLSVQEALNHHPTLKVLITYVCYNEFEYSDLVSFSEILGDFNNRVYLKINNLLPNDRNRNLNPLPNKKLSALIRNLIKEKPQWKNRIVFISNSDAISNYSEIKFH